MSIFEELVDVKLLKILKLFLRNKESHFHLNKISADSKVPVATVFRIIPHLVELNLIEQISIGKLKIYKLAKNSKTKELQKVFKYG
jgi:DNA-binding IclR family transcriptional regulator